MSATTYPGLTPLLLPSGPQWSEKWTDCDPPPLVRYDYHRYRSRWVNSWHDRVQSWPQGAWLLTIDSGSWLGRLWWKHVVAGGATVLWRLRARTAAQRLADRSSAYPFGGTAMSWRFAIGPDVRPWVSGDVQPQDGCWPISVAVYDGGRA